MPSKSFIDHVFCKFNVQNPVKLGKNHNIKNSINSVILNLNFGPFSPKTFLFSRKIDEY